MTSAPLHSRDPRPAGLAGVSALCRELPAWTFATSGDQPDVLVCMNPAALKVHLPDLPRGGMIIVNTDEFNPANLKKAGYDANPLEDDTLSSYRVYKVPIGTLNARALRDTGLSAQEIDHRRTRRPRPCSDVQCHLWTSLKYIDERFRAVTPQAGRQHPHR